MPHRVKPYRLASFVGFLGIFLFASVGLMQLPALGQAETAVRGLAWIAVAAAIALLARAWWNLALEIFGTRMNTAAFVLLVAFVAWVWIWFAIVVVKCEGSLPACGAWRPMVDVGALIMWVTFAWVVWWRTERWIFSVLLLAGSIMARLPIYVKDLPAGTRPVGVCVLSLGLVLSLAALFRKAPDIESSSGSDRFFQAGWFQAVLVVTAFATLVVVSLPYILTWLGRR
jgi:hypothetical protein